MDFKHAVSWMMLNYVPKTDDNGERLDSHGLVEGKGKTLGYVRHLYEKDYWMVCRCDGLPPNMRLPVFVTAVDLGPVVAIRILQKQLGLKKNGEMSDDVLHAAESIRGMPHARAYMAERIMFQKDDYSFNTFGRFNIMRCFDILESVEEYNRSVDDR